MGELRYWRRVGKGEWVVVVLFVGFIMERSARVFPVSHRNIVMYSPLEGP